MAPGLLVGWSMQLLSSQELDRVSGGGSRFDWIEHDRTRIPYERGYAPYIPKVGRARTAAWLMTGAGVVGGYLASHLSGLRNWLDAATAGGQK